MHTTTVKLFNREVRGFKDIVLMVEYCVLPLKLPYGLFYNGKFSPGYPCF